MWFQTYVDNLLPPLFAASFALGRAIQAEPAGMRALFDDGWSLGFVVAGAGERDFPGDLTIFEAVMGANPNKDTANLGRVRLIRADPTLDPLMLLCSIKTEPAP